MNRVLLIDDDTELCELLLAYLNPEGFEVETSNDGAEGIRLALAKLYELVLLDVMLPGNNGFEIFRHIREKSAVPVLRPVCGSCSTPSGIGQIE